MSLGKVSPISTSGSSGDAAGKTGYSPLGVVGPYLWAVKPHLYFVIVILCILLGKINDIYIFVCFNNFDCYSKSKLEVEQRGCQCCLHFVLNFF